MKNLWTRAVVNFTKYFMCCAPTTITLCASPADAQSPPEPVPPAYSQVKKLYRTTDLVKDGRPNSVIVVGSAERYSALAQTIQKAVKNETGITLPIVPDDSPQANVPLQRNLILLGNRSTNKVVSKLYDLYYTFTDLKYPGPGGFEVRTLHNPFGNGFNGVLLGGSGDNGVEAAARRFTSKIINAKAQNGTLTLERLMDIQLGEGLVPPKELKDFRIWEGSSPRGYGEVGYFGWNSISKRLAMYYMTGDETQAREALRLAFPDAAAKKVLTEFDGELIENKNDPLAGPYHYGATMMILLWDLVEESDVFTDAERLKVTNAFSRQLAHREDADEGGVYSVTRPATTIGGRHALFSAISLFCLSRYFAKDYPDVVWQQALKGVGNYLAPLRQEWPWVSGNNDNLFWYVTVLTPILQYVLLSGNRDVIHPKALAALLRIQEVLINGSKSDTNIRFSSLEFYNKAAYLTGDGRWITYRNRLDVDTQVFRLGQSFWPDSTLQAADATDLHNRWTISRMTAAQMASRATGFTAAESFSNASFRNTTGEEGDFLLLDGMNGGGRNPYHTFAILDLRLQGQTLLLGYLNQVLTKADGMVEPQVALDGALKFADVVGQTATSVGEVPKAAFCNWRRSIVQRVGRYALVVDDLGFRTDSKHFEAQFLWQRRNAQSWTAKGSSLLLTQPGQKSPTMQIAHADPMPAVIKGNAVELMWEGVARQGTHRIFFSLLGPTGQSLEATLKCVRLADNAAALNLPQPALAVAGQFQNVAGDLVVLAEDHLYGQNIRRAGLDSLLLNLDVPAHIDWDFLTGKLAVINDRPLQLSLVLPAKSKLQLEGKLLAATTTGNTLVMTLPAGRHSITGARLSPAKLAELRQKLTKINKPTSAKVSITPARVSQAVSSGVELSNVPALQERFTANFSGDLDAFATARTQDGPKYFVASKQTIYAFDAAGKPLGSMQTDGAIYRLHWWPEHNLLIAGCDDEKVIAFDAAGQRKWTFVSEMDPAVLCAAKQYWFKSAPGHGGIQGLDSGVFLDGKSQLFVGSACTIEFVDENGRLVKRIPQFWGAVHLFQIVPGPNGSLNLLASRRLTDRPSLGVINNQTIDTTNFSSGANYRFMGVPSGYTDVVGWMDQTRFHIFHLDVDGDGKKEIISEVTGAWNRVTVWDEQGRAKYNAHFGPGENPFTYNLPQAPKTSVRGIDVGDVVGNNTPEIIVALSNGLIVALDGQCRKLWSQKLKSTPSILKIVGGKIVVGGENGDVSVLDGQGNLLQSAKMGSRIAILQPTNSQQVVVGCKGELKVFGLESSPNKS